MKYAAPLLNTPQLNKSTKAFNGVNLAVTDVNLTWQALTIVNFTGQAGQAG